MQRVVLNVRFVALVVMGATFAPLCAAGETDASFPTLLNYYHAADAALIVKRAYVEPPTANDEEAVVETVQVLRDSSNSIVAGSRISVRGGLPATPDKLALVLGSRAANTNYHNLGSMYWCSTCRHSMGRPIYDGIRWEARSLDMSPAAIEFVRGSPSPAIVIERRLEYFAKSLDAADAMIAREAFAEIANAVNDGKYLPIADLSPQKIRIWLLDPTTPMIRRGVYGVMLGMCGVPDDATVLDAIIADPNAGPDGPVGIEGVMIGYLFLEGERGLKSLEIRILADRESSDFDVYSLYLAMRYLRRHGNGKIPLERINAAMKLLLGRPGLEEVAIHDLAAAKDWSLQKQLMERYGTGQFGEKSTKRAIINYMIASTKDVPKISSEPLPPHASDGAKYLEQLRATDAKLVADAEEFFFLR